ncbi:HAD family hydrolase [Radiobacillus kanasensis]|uniref:HAD family hydrolase n=1 Tax=Radiobacillus kanasensis TaxID=2844358 RepID=UPI001E4C1DC6|nr:HAD family hydrolase [Radiobacillus kanasensis]UFU00703.1 HAD family hydrolase [Radiobacillus kanasensis]
MKAIIFDFDGTLADTLPVCFYGFRKAFDHYDKRALTDEEIIGMFGPTEADIIRKNLQHKDKEEAVELYFDVYKHKHEELVPKNNEIAALLEELKQKGFKLGMVTGKARRSLEISLQKLDMQGIFDITITGDDVELAKPDPEGLNKALQTLEVSPNQAMFIGDSNADIQAGSDAGVMTVGVHWLDHVQTKEFSVQPDEHFESVETFKQWVQKWY